jgi:hypothetical protein
VFAPPPHSPTRLLRAPYGRVFEHTLALLRKRNG